VAPVIRDEAPHDLETIRAVNRSAFDGEVEAALVDRLRDDAQVIASRVAEDQGRIVGHILFSPVWIELGDRQTMVASLAPMAVDSKVQRQGIGSALVRDGIEVCRRAGYPAVIVVGHPAYYPRFGFSARAVAHLDSPYAGDAFMGLDLVAGTLATLRGRVRYPSAFDSLGP
jgi:putative acetyltransferase